MPTQNADRPSTEEPKKSSKIPVNQDWRQILWYATIAMLLLWIWQDVSQTLTVKVIPYSEFKGHVAAGEVTQCEITDNSIVGEVEPSTAASGYSAESDSDAETSAPAAKSASENTKPQKEKTFAKTSADENTATDEQDKKKVTANTDANEPFSFRTVRIDDPDLVKELEAAGVEFVGVRPGFMSQFLQWWLLPLALMFLLWRLLSRGIGNAGQAAMGFGRSKAKLVADTDTGVSFDDVAGCVEAKFELQEVVDFLKNPKRYVALGATIPKGVLLVGPPGTGKTLLARAVAGEAKVPFFSISGSEFVEMFVGVGAARVRDLFEQGKQSAPCIIFIDELDAIGRERGVHVATVNDEREQTLNQLLVELDGFEENAGVIILSATNRPEVLDRALLRPGRFDRQVLVDSPDVEGRLGILNVHARNKPLTNNVNLRDIARSTPGFSGADLKNVMNEAALLAARRKSTEIAKEDLDEAVEKVVAGPERKSRRLGDEERRRVAFHEVGHALVATHSDHADPVRKISIIPRGQAALGYTLQLPTEEQFLMTRSEIDDRVRGLLGGRAAEDLVYGEVSSGAENDLEKATAMVRQMVCMFGMSEAVGLAHCGHRAASTMAETGVFQRDCSEQTANTIDEEVNRILAAAYQDAKHILKDHRDQLDLVAEELLQKETLNKEEFQRMLGDAQSDEQDANVEAAIGSS